MTRLQEFIKAIQHYSHAIIFAKQALTPEEHNAFIDKIWEGTKYPFKRTLTLATQDDKLKAEVLVACYIDTVIEGLRQTKELEVLKNAMTFIKAMNEIEIEVQEWDHRVEEDDPVLDEDPVEESDLPEEEDELDQSSSSPIVNDIDQCKMLVDRFSGYIDELLEDLTEDPDTESELAIFDLLKKHSIPRKDLTIYRTIYVSGKEESDFMWKKLRALVYNLKNTFETIKSHNMSKMNAICNFLVQLDGVRVRVYEEDVNSPDTLEKMFGFDEPRSSPIVSNMHLCEMLIRRFSDYVNYLTKEPNVKVDAIARHVKLDILRMYTVPNKNNPEHRDMFVTGEEEKLLMRNVVNGCIDKLNNTPDDSVKMESAMEFRDYMVNMNIFVGESSNNDEEHESPEEEEKDEPESRPDPPIVIDKYQSERVIDWLSEYVQKLITDVEEELDPELKAELDYLLENYTNATPSEDSPKHRTMFVDSTIARSMASGSLNYFTRRLWSVHKCSSISESKLEAISELKDQLYNMDVELKRGKWRDEDGDELDESDELEKVVGEDESPEPPIVNDMDGCNRLIYYFSRYVDELLTDTDEEIDSELKSKVSEIAKRHTFAHNKHAAYVRTMIVTSEEEKALMEISIKGLRDRLHETSNYPSSFSKIKAISDFRDWLSRIRIRIDEPSH